MARDHIVSAYDDALVKLSESLASMGGLAEHQINAALKAVLRRDDDLASRVVNGDARIDSYDQQIEQDVYNLLALRQPMATDLREVLSALKIANDLERIGDYAANIAKRALALNAMPVFHAPGAIQNLGRLAAGMVKDVLDAYVNRDAALAREIWRRDTELDDLYTSLFRELLTYMMEDPRNITPSTHLIFIAKNIERIGDHATNIAETLHFLITGRALDEVDRPKGDTSAYTVTPYGHEASGRAPDSGPHGSGGHA